MGTVASFWPQMVQCIPLEGDGLKTFETMILLEAYFGELFGFGSPLHYRTKLLKHRANHVGE